jgi:hypothetical protein
VFEQPLIFANFSYSISNSTNVSECSETKAIGTITKCLFNFEFFTITSSVDGSIHLRGPTLL